MEMSNFQSKSKSQAIPAVNAFVLELKFTIDSKATSTNDEKLKYSHSPFPNDAKLKAHLVAVRERHQTKTTLAHRH